MASDNSSVSSMFTFIAVLYELDLNIKLSTVLLAVQFRLHLQNNILI